MTVVELRGSASVRTTSFTLLVVVNRDVTGLPLSSAPSFSLLSASESSTHSPAMCLRSPAGQMPTPQFEGDGPKNLALVGPLRALWVKFPGDLLDLSGGRRRQAQG